MGNSRFSLSGDMIAGVEIENGSCDLDHAPFRGWFVVHMQNLTILALAVPDIIGSPKI